MVLLWDYMEEEGSVVKLIEYSRTRLLRLEHLLYHIDIHMALSKLLSLSMPQYSHLQSGDDIVPIS